MPWERLSVKIDEMLFSRKDAEIAKKIIEPQRHEGRKGMLIKESGKTNWG
jgi:hypothetical protein